ncbi:nucleolar complex-associated protein 3 [Phragmites australis]|uniref:nucleolar complex-associated protein 3 n=1 Tax=Phragmites australis TaxID=29695 RepID=UPI002D781D11|nr:nucleolar complex-associated protein 3 [Phragmites australis]
MGKRSGNKKRKDKVILPPELPEVDDDQVVVSDEDIEFFSSDKRRTDLFRKFDQKSIDRYVRRITGQDEGEVERLYEERERKRKAAEALKPRREDDDLEVDPVDALPIKTLQGELVYNNAKKTRSEGNASIVKSKTKEEDADGKQRIQKDEWKGKSKNKKGDSKLQNVQSQIEVPKGKLHSEVLEEVKQELSAEELFEKKKAQLAELGMAMLEDPESNIRSLNDMLSISNDKDQNVVKLGLMSLLAVFKDIIPSYRVRQLTEKELTVEVSKEVKKTRYYEYTLIRCYKAYLQKLISLEKQPRFYSVAVRCMCALLDTAPHFNFHESLLASVVKNLSSSDDVVRKMCCETVRSLFINEGKHRGEATIEAVRLIADHVKLNDCQLHPDSIEVFLSLRFDEDLGKDKTEEENGKPKKNKRWQNKEVSKQLPVSDKKKTRKELISKAREEVDTDLKAVSFTLDPKNRRRIQKETLSALFETYFRILKHSMSTSISRSKGNNVSLGGSHPLLGPCLEGLGKFSHLIDLDFMGELISCLKKLSGYTDHQDKIRHDDTLSISERLQCCIVAFKVWRSNLEALNVDLQDFFVQLYNLILEYRPDRDRGEVLADALKTLLWEGKQQDMLRAAAFIKRLATFALSFGSAEAIAALITLKHLLQKNSKCRYMLENDSGGGSLSCLVAKYDPEAKDPYLSGALASVLWELSLLEKHYDISVSSMASNILSMANLNPTQNPVPILNVNPLQAYRDLSIERELSKSDSKALSLNCKKKRLGKEFVALSPDVLKKADCLVDKDELKEKLQSHFAVLRGISENERLRAELNHTLSSINMYKEYKKQKKKNMKSKTGRKKVANV